MFRMISTVTVFAALMPLTVESRAFAQFPSDVPGSIVIRASSKPLGAEVDVRGAGGAGARVHLGGGTYWYLEEVPNSGGAYKIRDSRTGLLLSAHLPDVQRNGCRVILYPDAVVFANQHWRIVPIDDGSYKIINRASGLLLSAHLPDVQRDGCEIVLYEDVQIFPNQHWFIEFN